MKYTSSTEGSEMLAIRTQTPENYPKENILHTEHGESLKSRIVIVKYMNGEMMFQCHPRIQCLVLASEPRQRSPNSVNCF